MKSIYTLLILVLWSMTGISQDLSPRSIGDTLGPWTIITLEEPTEFIQIAPEPDNIWQIGEPRKTFFNSAYTVPNAIVTGITGFYPVNNLSSFTLLICHENSYYQYPMDLFIDFRHKFDSDTLKDGGFISISWDLGQTWNNILDDSLSGWWFVSPFQPEGFPYGNTELYNKTDTLCNGEHGFSGRSNDWVHSCMAWYDLTVTDGDYFPPDTMLLRFSFVSDGIQNNREGWMIDQIRIFSLDLGSGIGEESTVIKAKVVPNPVRSDAIVTLDKSYSLIDYTISDFSGKTILYGRGENSDRFFINNKEIIPGIYLMKITSDDNSLGFLKVVFSNP
ncbi:MAG: T9SS type A sorting domain-containing protein [bacterium]